MLDNRFYLYRPWIPICKAIEAGIVKGLELEPPVLDIGCGNGLFGTYCFREKIDCGLDYDENAVKEARERGTYKKVEAADARELPFKDNSFKTVISVCALEHIPELNKVLDGISRVLVKGGRLVFTVPSEEFGDFLFGSRLLRIFGLRKIAKRYGDNKNSKSDHFHIYPPLEWRDILEKKGFSIESIDHIFPKEAVFLWSFFHSFPFRIIFLPFRLLRDLRIRLVDNILRAILTGLLSCWIEGKTARYPKDGGYLIIQARKF